MEFLRNWIITIISVIIFVTFIEIIIPNNKNKKYINVVVGLLIIVVILNPVMHIYNRGLNFSDTVVQASNELETITTHSRVKNLESNQDQLIIDIYKSNLIEQMKNRIKQTTEFTPKEIVLEIYKDNENFGLIKSIELYLVEDLINTSPKKDSNDIETVNIDINLNKKQEVEREGKILSNKKSQSIKTDLSEFYNLPEENINIYIKNKNTSEEGNVDGS
ncbi:stage III sporulation protein AF [Serpentinicella sp. ANB-PHB4]|uniref:stage III sporulation protein AF n=1 Tax=Serpentinicella sp. ANB-PHB4 TaxID=3074076 RepID=UPI0028575FC9|nr:stage III sporulation protein AF [Serpentinicella sp. ANB-PHB4]MDR5658195.1 stage III sporulation protein AF [Serpentinicella sp. ANB-PHB4]